MDVNVNVSKDIVSSMHQDINNLDKLTNQKTDNQQKNKANEELLTKHNLKTLVDEANKLLDPHLSEIHYVFHEKLNQYYVRIEDSITHETIREIPPKKFLDMFAAVAEKLGLIVDHKV